MSDYSIKVEEVTTTRQLRLVVERSDGMKETYEPDVWDYVSYEQQRLLINFEDGTVRVLAAGAWLAIETEAV